MVMMMVLMMVLMVLTSTSHISPKQLIVVGQRKANNDVDDGVDNGDDVSANNSVDGGVDDGAE
eukprot:10932322-Ditylum_brightwellii.AAC.1